MMQNTFSAPAPPTSDAEESMLRMAVSDSEQFKTFFRQIRKIHPRQSLRVAFLHMAENGADECARACMIPWLQLTDYFDSLLDPDFVPGLVARRVADILAAEDPQFFLHFQKWIKQPHENEQTLRALFVAEGLSDSSALLSWMKGLTNAADERTRSQAVKLICRVRANPALIGRQMASSEYRVRANAIEALWGVQTEEVRTLFQKALEDDHHRVVMNALVGLFYQKDAEALPKILDYTHHPFEMYRAAALWAIGLVGDASAIPTLTAIAESDPSKHVRQRAHDLLEKLKQPAAVLLQK